MLSVILVFLSLDYVSLKCNSGQPSSYQLPATYVAWRHTFDKTGTGDKGESVFPEEKLVLHPERVGGEVLYCERNCIRRFANNKPFFSAVTCKKGCEEYAFSFWFKLDQRHTEGNFTLFELIKGQPYHGLDVKYSNANRRWLIKTFSQGDDITLVEFFYIYPENPYVWHHVTIRRDQGNVVHAYLNGKPYYKQVETGTDDQSHNATKRYLSSSSPKIFVYFDEFVAWEKDVGEEEILAHYFNDPTVVEQEREYEEMRLISRYNNL